MSEESDAKRLIEGERKLVAREKIRTVAVRTEFDN